MMETATIVTFLWRGERGYRPFHVAAMAEGLRRHMRSPYRFICLSDDTDGNFGGADVRPIPGIALKLGEMKSPEGRRFPSCYQRLWLFSGAAWELGSRILLTDVDAVVTGDWSPLFDYDCDFIGWQPGQSWGNTEKRLAGGMWLLRTGTRQNVFTEFIADPEGAIARARQVGFRGSDQAWISYKLSADSPVWPNGSGIYRIWDFARGQKLKVVREIPSDSRVVHFNGYPDLWSRSCLKQYPWMREHWSRELLGDPEAEKESIP